MPKRERKRVLALFVLNRGAEIIVRDIFGVTLGTDTHTLASEWQGFVYSRGCKKYMGTVLEQNSSVR